MFLHPIDGARREGFAGFSKGLGIGLGGFVLKLIAGMFRPLTGKSCSNLGTAAWGIGGYTYEGVNKELEKLFGSSIKGHIALARLAQGSEEVNSASNEEIADVIVGWEVACIRK